MHALNVTWMSERDEEAISPSTTRWPGGRRHARHGRQLAQAEQADRLARAGIRRRRRLRPAVLAARTAVSFAVLGGVYLGVHYAASGPAGRSASRPAVQPDFRARVSPAQASPAPSKPHPAGQAGDYAITQAHYTFTEHSAVAGSRILRVTVRFPDIDAASEKYPLIVFAPGFRQCAASYSDLLRQWASAGYVVAALDFPLTNCHIAAPDESDLSNQPADMIFVIQRLLRLSDRPGDRLTRLVAADRVAVAGHSDGGDTVAAMAAMSCCRYPGLRAVIVLAGAEWPPLRGKWFSAPAPPMLFVQGTADTWNPPAASVQLYRADTTGTRYYLELFGANHFAPYEGVSEPEPVVEQVTLGFLDRYLAGQSGAPGAIRRAARNPGVSELVSGGRMP
jgi:dienelactone hydrolase